MVEFYYKPRWEFIVQQYALLLPDELNEVYCQALDIAKNEKDKLWLNCK